MLAYEEPGSKATLYNRKIYRRLKQWLDVKRSEVSFEFTSLAEEEVVELDTARVAQDVSDLLDKLKISRTHFAVTHLGTIYSRFKELVENPVEWTRCDFFQRDLYKRMHEWTVSKKKN
jgi:hypothetical protein